jgi:hypothetical protein
MNRVLLAVLVTATACSHTTIGKHTAALTAVAAPVCDGVTDDRVAVQAAIDAHAGRELVLPAGTCLITQNPGHYWSLMVPAGTTLRGTGRSATVLQQAPGAGPSVQLLEVLGAADVTITDLTLDGRKAEQTVDPHRALIFAKQSPRLTLRRLTLQHATGDGVEIYDGSDDPDVYDVLATGNDRNGLTLGGGTRGGMFAASQFVGNAAQQFDSEGAPVHGVTIRGCLFDGGTASTDYVLTMTGMGADLMSHGWTVTDNVVNGSALMVWITDVVYARNTGVNPTPKPSVRVYRTADKIRIQDNVLSTTAPASFDAGGLVYITGTGAGQTPAGVVVSGNTLTTSAAAFGVVAIGARDITVVNNTLTGAGGARGSEAGVFIRAVHPDVPTVSATIRGNRIANFGQYGVLLGGNGTAQIQSVEIAGNWFADTAPAPSMTKALYLGDDTNVARRVTAVDNALAGGTTVMIARPPAGAWTAYGDGGRWVMP